MTILVLGSTGQLGQHLRAALPAATFWSRSDANLADPVRLEQCILAARPSAIVVAAAYTAVDRAEQEPELAWRVNCEAPAAAARAAAALRIPLVQVSTDYVFDGRSRRPYRESDPVYPLNVYGRTKLAGELAVATLCPRHWILRTSWLFSEHGSNFVKTMLRLAAERDTLQVVADQRGRPTYAGDLARLIAALLERAAPHLGLDCGTYHTGGGPACSWNEFAQQILRRAQAKGILARAPSIAPIATKDYATLAVRPAYSVLEPSAALDRVGSVRFDWEAGLEIVLDRIRGA
jgi:dTDP-4-dehydrorhamnose reductase